MHNQIIFNNAVKKSQKDIVKKLMLEKDVDPSAEDNFAILHFIYMNDYEMVDLFLKDKRVNPLERNSIPILLAIEKEYDDIVELLWSNKKVKISLKNNDLKVYNYLKRKHLKNNLNEF